MFARIALICSLTGCLANPATGVQATNEPLRVKYSSGTGTYTQNEVVGTDVYRDADGNETGSKDIYRPVTHEFRWKQTEFFQGRAEIDEHDYYRLAGDQQGADQIQKHRDSAMLRQRIGVPLMVAGIAAGVVLSSIGRSGDGQLATTGYIAGSLVGTAGGLVWLWGRRDMQRKPVLAPGRSDRNADVIQVCEERRCRTMRGGRN